MAKAKTDASNNRRAMVRVETKKDDDVPLFEFDDETCPKMVGFLIDAKLVKTQHGERTIITAYIPEDQGDNVAGVYKKWLSDKYFEVVDGKKGHYFELEQKVKWDKKGKAMTVVGYALDLAEAPDPNPFPVDIDVPF